MNKKTNFLLHLIFIIGCSNIVDEDSLIEKDALKYAKNSSSPFTGDGVGKYPSGEDRVRGNYKDGKEFFIKQKVWIILDSNQISVKSVFGYLDGEEMVVFDSAPDELYRVVNALPEGLKQMVSSKAL